MMGPTKCPTCEKAAWQFSKEDYHAWKEAGTASCPACIKKALHAPTAPATSKRTCAGCGTRVSPTAGPRCDRCKTHGIQPLSLFEGA